MKSRRMIRVAAVLLLVAAAGVMAFVARIYRGDRNSYEREYTAVVKSRDIVDTSRNAVSALQDAESQVHGYVLTGETSYSEAYAGDLRVWQDESGTLELEAVHDPLTSLVKDFSKSGSRAAEELAAVFALRNEGSTAPALDRLRKGSAIVYLEQARMAAEKLQQEGTFTANSADRRIATTAPFRHLHLTEGAGALFGIALVEGLLLFVSTRQKAPRATGV